MPTGQSTLRASRLLPELMLPIKLESVANSANEGSDPNPEKSRKLNNAGDSAADYPKSFVPDYNNTDGPPSAGDKAEKENAAKGAAIKAAEEAKAAEAAAKQAKIDKEVAELKAKKEAEELAEPAVTMADK